MSLPRMILLLLLLFISAHTFTVAQDTEDVSYTPDSSVNVPDSSYLKFKLDSMNIERRARERQAAMVTHKPIEDVVPVIGVMIPIVFLVIIGILIYRRIEATRLVRMSMIANGMDPGMLNAAPDENSRKYGALRVGMLLAGIGLGLLIGMIVTESMHLREEVAAFSVIASALLFGGVGLIGYHRMVAKMEQKS